MRSSMNDVNCLLSLIADDRGSHIADLKKVCDYLRSYGNTSTIVVCDPAIVIAGYRKKLRMRALMP